MNNNPNIANKIEDRIAPISISVTLALAIAWTGSAGAQESKAAEPRAGVAKAGETRSAKGQSMRPRIATQKRMRYPWEKPDPKMAAGAYGISNEALPYFYW